MQIDQTWVSLVSACTALMASIAGPFVTLRVGRQQFKANVLSVNRQRWIETLRDSVASLTSQFAVAASLKVASDVKTLSLIVADAGLLKRVEDLSRTVARIDLMLNPHETDHRHLHEVMHRALGWLRADEVSPDLVADMDGVSAEIIQTAQGILKREWTRVKRGT